MTDPIADFVDSLSAVMQGFPSIEGYIESHEEFLAKLEAIDGRVKAVRVQSLDDYLQTQKLAAVLSSLFCYTFNKSKPEFERVGAIDRNLDKKLLQFAKHYDQAKSFESKALIKYVCWNQYYPNHDTEKIVGMLLQEGRLFCHVSDGVWKAYFVSGMHLQTGDNVFTPDKKGRNHRCFNESWALQAFSVSNTWHGVLEEMEATGKITIPPLSAHYDRVFFGGGRHQARLMFTRREQKYIYANFLRRR